MAAAAAKTYEDFNPTTDNAHEKDCDIILLYLPGFKKEDLKVQLLSTNSVRVRGEREIGNNKFIRFQKEFPITPEIDSNRITAKFEKSILYVRLPKATDSAASVPAKLEDEERKKPDATKEDKRSYNEDVGGSGSGKIRELGGTNAAEQAAKLKISRRVFLAVLVGFAAVGLGFYVTKFIGSFRTPEISA